jgi:type I restriction enzyme, S subunit
MRWRPYQTLRPSGVAWLGDVPAHWLVKRLKRVVHVSGGMTPDKSEPDFWDGDMPWVTAKDMKSLRLADSEDHVSPSALRATGLKPVTPPASLIVVRGMILAHTFPVAEIDAPVTINQDMKALRPVADVAPGYLAWMLRGASGYVLSIADESAHGTKALRTDRLFEMQIPLPPADEQRAIAAFLDRETARIDALVAAKRRLIALLQDKRAALIARAVTRGLDPEVPTKDSGVAWLGRVPAHWEVGHLRRFASVTDCKHYTVTFADDGLPVASVGELSGNRFSLKNAKRTTPGEYEFLRAGRVPRRGALLYCRNASVGLVGHIDTDEPFALGQDVCLIDAQDTDGRYLYYQLISRAVTAQLESKMVGATFNRINVADIKEFAIAWPPPPEQATISRMLNGATAALERQERLAYLTIERLDEYRSTLITSAVTGRIDVRAAA